MIDISKLLTFAVQQGASDCHISSGEPPMVRLHGDLKKLDYPALSQDETHALIYDMMSDVQRKNFEEHRECDFSFDLGDIARSSRWKNSACLRSSARFATGRRAWSL